MEYRDKLDELGITLRKNGKQTCPKCSQTRKNKDDKCLSVTYGDEAVLYNCHHCGWSGAVYYRSKYELKKDFKKPQEPKIAKDLTPVQKYFEKRGISPKTLDKYKVTCNDKKQIIFPYYKNGELVNVKLRTNLGNGKKTFTQSSDSEKTLFGMDIIQDYEKPLIWVEGECFKGDTEILTPKGWVRLDEYNGQKVMQVDYILHGQFVEPIAYVNKDFEGKILEYKSKNGVLCATENHNIVYSYTNYGKLCKKPFKDVPKNVKIPTSINFDGGIEIEENLLKLLVAIQADGSLDYRKNGNIHIRFTVKKQRKAERIENILKALHKEYSKSVDNKGYFYFGFTENSAFKIFPNDWFNLTEKSRNILLAEILHWDGNSVPNRNQIEYSTKIIQNAVFIQTMAHLSGYSSTIIKRENKYGKWYKVSILYNKNSFSLCKKPQTEEYKGKVYCVQVPSGLILTRTNNKITVTGNCDVLALAEQGIYSVSIPQGASENKLECIENCFEFIQQFKQHIIAVDNDKQGDKLKLNLLSRLGRENCKIVNWKQYKDANEALMAGEQLKDFIEKADFVNPDGIINFFDETDAIYKYNYEIDKDYYSTGWKDLDNIIKIRTGYLMIVTGYPSRGKSTFVDNLLINLSRNYGLKHLIASFESIPASHFNSLIEMYLQKPIYAIRQEEQIFGNGFEFIANHFYRFDVNRTWTIDEIAERAELAVRKYGINTLVIDPYNRLKNDYNDREDKYIGSILSKLSMLSKKLNILIIFVAHPKKPDGEAMPNMYSISGSGDWYNMADYGIIVHRERGEDKKLKNTPEICIAKIKNFSLGNPSGGSITLNYNKDKRILEDMSLF